MKLNFLRQGFAFNSSSTHSLIFTNEDLMCDRDASFGWNEFTCSSQEYKLKYMVLCLYSSWVRLTNLSCEYESDIGWIEIEEIKKEQFRNYISTNFPYLQSHFEYCLENDGHVDHQSIMTFPRHRQNCKINVQFSHEFIQAFVNDNFVMLGGNDNSESDAPHPNAQYDIPDEGKAIKYMYAVCNDINSNYLMCEKDNVIGDYVISNREKGTIIRVQTC